MSNKTIDLIIRNTKSNPATTIQRVPSESSALPTLSHSLNPLQTDPHFDDRIQKLQGNLKMLQKKYRTNLKQGFEHKIKAYRLQAVMQRKILKHAINQTKKYQQLQVLKSRMEQNEQSKGMDKSRIQMLRAQREEEYKYKRESTIRTKRGITLSLYEKRQEIQRLSKQSHDQVVQEAANGDKKKNYFEYIRKASLKREEDVTKRDLLDRIVRNTDKLKELKMTLEEMHEQPKRDQTFLTI